MAITSFKRLTRGFIPVATLLVVLLASLSMMGDATQNSAQFSQRYSFLLLINGIGIVILIGLIGSHLFRLMSQYQKGVAGSRLTARMVVMFVLLSVLPVSVVYYFSLQFLHRSIDSWFDVRIEGSLEDALELSRTSLDIRMRELLRQSEQMSAELADVSDALATLPLNDLRVRSGASELTLTTLSGVVITTSSLDRTSILPSRPGEEILLQLRQGYPYVGLAPIRNSGLHVRVVVRVEPGGQITEPRTLQALFEIPERMSTLADSVQSAFALYKELAYLRKPLKYSFTLTLSLVLLLSVLSAVWAAFFSARRLVAPIRHLAEGTRAVAGGDYSKRLPLPGSDEMGTLVRSFNEMTRRLEQARNESFLNQQQMEQQRGYLQTVLGHLSSGVLAIDDEGVLRTCNSAAEQILSMELGGWIGKSLREMAEQTPFVLAFCDVVVNQAANAQPDWSEEVVLFGPEGRKVLMCQGSRLPSGDAEFQGHVIVFDDISALIQAQRDSAWGEVARRLAHEIKNPLTPIQLSAERLRHKYLATATGEERDVLDRYTHTIIQQVELMKEMVNAFSDYARAPQIQREAVALNTIIDEVLDLYRNSHVKVQFVFEAGVDIPVLFADAGRLRQVMHNLVKNAIDAIQETDNPQVTIITSCSVQDACRYVEWVVRDNGHGFPDELLASGFEPYVTTKTKGTGLGLAIVKKIVEEHHGMIQAQNRPEGGAEISIRLPVGELDALLNEIDNPHTESMPEAAS